ncbi:MAG: hypothetical protein JWR00_2262 [Rubritepida sp.]|jgi:hypothetical protein|nr:hypothetical protein [Rubritepida sp.]
MKTHDVTMLRYGRIQDEPQSTFACWGDGLAGAR